MRHRSEKVEEWARRALTSYQIALVYGYCLLERLDVQSVCVRYDESPLVSPPRCGYHELRYGLGSPGEGLVAMGVERFVEIASPRRG